MGEDKEKTQREPETTKHRFNMEVTLKELIAYKAAAKAADMSMSSWVRHTLRKALK